MYVVLELVQSLEFLSLTEARTRVQARINSLRRQDSVEPVLFSEDIQPLAQDLADRKAAGKKSLSLPSWIGDAQVLYWQTTSLELNDQASQELKNALFSKGAVGIWFGRTTEYPGGVYSLAIVSVFIPKIDDRIEENLRKIVLGQIQKLRQKKRLPSLLENVNLTKWSSKMTRLSQKGQSPNPRIPDGVAPDNITLYTTTNPMELASELIEKVTAPGLKEIGIGISFYEAERTTARTLLVAAVMK